MGQGSRRRDPALYRHQGHAQHRWRIADSVDVRQANWRGRVSDNRLRALIVVKQRRESDCGLAALATVIKYYCSSVDYDDISRAISFDCHGTNLLHLSMAAERIGFSTRGLKVSYDAISNLALPAIAHIRRTIGGGHFVVVHCWNPSDVILADPAVGIRKVSRKAFCRCWTGHLLAFAPTPASQGANRNTRCAWSAALMSRG